MFAKMLAFLDCSHVIQTFLNKLSPKTDLNSFIQVKSLKTVKHGLFFNAKKELLNNLFRFFRLAFIQTEFKE